MTTITFDTQELVNELENNGFTRQQSEVVITVLKKSQGELTTKADLRDLELSLEAKISDIKYDLIKWIAGMLLAQVAVIAALVKLL